MSSRFKKLTKKITSNRSRSNSHHSDASSIPSTIGGTNTDPAMNGIGDTNDSAMDIFQMQMELTELRNQIKVLESGTSRVDLLELLQERDVEIEKKDQQIQLLNEKFYQITEGLHQIEDERQSLRQSTKSLESEKTKLQGYLGIREKEVVSLAQRCVSQEERMQEFKDIKIINAKIKRENEDLRKMVDRSKLQAVRIVQVEKELTRSEEENSKLVSENKNMKASHEESADELNNIISSLRGNITVGEERESNLKTKIDRACKAQSKERLSHETKINDLEGQFSKSRDNVDKLRQEVTDHESTISNNTSEIDRCQTKIDQNMTEMESMESRRVQTAKKHDEDVARLESGKAESEARLTLELNSKSEQICCLEKEVNNFQDNLTSAKSDLTASITDNAEQVKCHQAKIEELNLTIQAVKSNSAILNKELGSLQTKFDNSTNQIAKLQEERSTMKERMAESSDLESQLGKVIASVSQHQMENAQKEKIAAEELSEAYRQRNEVILRKSDMEAELKERLEAAQNESDSMKSNLTDRLEKKEAIISNIRLSIDNQEHIISSLKSQMQQIKLNGERECKSQTSKIDKQLKEIEILEASLSKREEDLSELKGSLTKAHNNISELNATVTSLQKDISTSELQAAELVGEFEMKFERSQREYKELDRNSRDKKEGQELLIRNLRNQIMVAMADKAKLESSAKSKISSLQDIINFSEERNQAKLSERHTTITTQMKKINEQEIGNDRLRKEVDELSTELENIDLQHQNVISALTLKLDQVRVQTEEDTMLRAEEADVLHEKILMAEKKIAEKEFHKKSLHSELEERTKLLADMVGENKILNHDLFEARTISSELQEELEKNESSKESAEFRIQKMKNDWIEKEAHLEQRLRIERQFREKLEYDLEDMKTTVAESKMENKNLVKLGKENKDLREKVERQEAYMKKKLKNEMALKKSTRYNGYAGSSNAKVVKSSNGSRSAIAEHSRV